MQTSRSGAPLHAVNRLAATLLGLALLAGCHANTAQGGSEDRGHSSTSAAQRQPPQHPANVPTPPSADQVDPNSPQAVLNGTSTTSPGTQRQPAPTPPPRSRQR